jgi:uncharacterized damage-inducible protein DinB
MPNRIIQRLQQQLERSYRSNAWHGPALLEALDGLDATKAAAKPLPEAHSIWESVLHCTIWMRFAEKAVIGSVVPPTPEEDWQPISDASEAAWQQALTLLDAEHKRLIDVLSLANDALLTQSVPNKNYDYYTLLQGVADHTIYHAGQIMILRKMLER